MKMMNLNTENMTTRDMTTRDMTTRDMTTRDMTTKGMTNPKTSGRFLAFLKHRLLGTGHGRDLVGAGDHEPQ
jgi:hypothetical protein